MKLTCQCKLTRMTPKPIITSTHAGTIREAVDKWAHKIDGPNPIDRLSGISLLEQIVRRELDAAAIEARDSGMSWAHIGGAVGITRQSAFVRWSKPGTPDPG